MIPKSVQKSLRKSVEDIQPDPDDPDDGINPFLELEMDTENGGEDIDHPPEMTNFWGTMVTNWTTPGLQTKIFSKTAFTNSRRRHTLRSPPRKK